MCGPDLKFVLSLQFFLLCVFLTALCILFTVSSVSSSVLVFTFFFHDPLGFLNVIFRG